MAPSRGNAPGSFVYESAQGSSVGASTFNTVYMLVDTPNSTSVVRFPYNRPIECGSLNVYENLLGSIPATGAPLISYYGVKGFHQNVVNGDLRVVRVGTPSVIKSISFNPTSATFQNIRAGQTVYAKIQINGVELGERTRQNTWLGIPITIPQTYADSLDTKQEISKTIIDALVAAIQANGDVRTSIYVRETTHEGFLPGNYGAYLTGRVFNGPVELVVSDTPNSSGTVLPMGAFLIEESVTESDRSVFDWIQTALTAFDDANLAKGYVCAPAAFQIYSQAERVNLGQSLEELSRDEDHKWLAATDCGPYYVTSQNRYKNFQEFDSSYGFKKDDLALVKNTIYKWTDTDPLSFTSANYLPGDATESANPNLENGARRALKDKQSLTVESAIADNTEYTFLLTEDLPDGLKTGDALTITRSTGATPPQYDEYRSTKLTDDATDTPDGQVEGVFYLNIPDLQEDDEDTFKKKIKLATSRIRAIDGKTITLRTANVGSPNGGTLLNITYSQPAWKFTQTIKNKTASLLQVNNSNGASFNTANLPASLQKPTAKYSLKLAIRHISSLGHSVFRGGDKLFYIAEVDVVHNSNTITIQNHGLNSGDAIWLTVPHSLQTGTELISDGNRKISYVRSLTDNTLQLFESPSQALASNTAAAPDTTGLRLFNDNSTPKYKKSDIVKNAQNAPTVAIITTGSDALIHSIDHGFKTNDEIYFTAGSEIASDGTTTNSNGITKLGVEPGKPVFVEYYDKNHFRIASTASNLNIGSFITYPAADKPHNGASTQIYKKLEFGLGDGNLRSSGNINWIKGRKYQLDATLGTVSVKDEANVDYATGTNTNTKKPWEGSDNYNAEDKFTSEIRLANIDNPKTTEELAIGTYGQANNTDNTLPIKNHGIPAGTAVRLIRSKGGKLPKPLKENREYYVVTPEVTNTGSPTATENFDDNISLALFKGGSIINLSNPAKVSVGGSVVVSNNSFNFSHTEDSSSEPLNESNNIAGDNVFFCVPQTSNNNEVYIHPVLVQKNQRIPLAEAHIKANFIEPSEEVPNNLWNFDAVTGEDLISEALRGVNNNGTPQVEIVEKGIDSHQRLNEECLKYGSSQGFLAFYGPYVKNDVDVYVPPTPKVLGMALTRYKDRPNGWILPPAGQRHSLAGARGVQFEITSAQQDISNRNGLNAIRQLPGYSQRDPDTGEVFGPVYVYGARTRVNPNNAEQRLYQFINTRVILNVIYATAKRAYDGEIFNVIEGAGATYDRISNIMYNLLHDNFYVPGALYGDTANEAFQVIVDDRNNTDTDLENGFVGVRAFVVPTPTLERIETDLVRVGIGQINNAVSAL